VQGELFAEHFRQRPVIVDKQKAFAVCHQISRIGSLISRLSLEDRRPADNEAAGKANFTHLQHASGGAFPGHVGSGFVRTGVPG
jgi:hypothetical protein